MEAEGEAELEKGLDFSRVEVKAEEPLRVVKGLAAAHFVPTSGGDGESGPLPPR